MFFILINFSIKVNDKLILFLVFLLHTNLNIKIQLKKRKSKTILLDKIKNFFFKHMNFLSISFSTIIYAVF
jgi:hypothetical protein